MKRQFLGGIVALVGGMVGATVVQGCFGALCDVRLDDIPNAVFVLDSEDAELMGFDQVSVDIRSETVVLTGVVEGESSVGVFDRVH